VSETPVPNHVYFVSDNREKVFAYRKASGGAVFEFKAPYKFNTRYRKFQEVANTFNYTVEEATPVFAGRIIKVQGSKGNTYDVTIEDGHTSCSCSGFKFRGKCKHTESITA
jgi:hypothetical protein